MPMNAVYQGPADLAEVIPVFPLPGALLLPRGQMPLNIFEPRYLEMIDDALADRHRLIGMIMPDAGNPGPESRPNLYRVGCVGRITQIAESGDGRYLIQLTGISRFRIEEELKVATAYRQCRVTYAPFTDDFIARKGEDDVDREAVLQALTDFLEANNLKTDWEGIESAPNEALVNALGDDVALWLGRETGLAGSPESQDPRGNSGRRDRDRTCKKQGAGRNPSAITR